MGWLPDSRTATLTIFVDDLTRRRTDGAQTGGEPFKNDVRRSAWILAANRGYLEVRVSDLRDAARGPGANAVARDHDRNRDAWTGNRYQDFAAVSLRQFDGAWRGLYSESAVATQAARFIREWEHWSLRLRDERRAGP